MKNNKLSIDDLDSGLARIAGKGEPDQYDFLEKSNLEDQRLTEEIKSLQSDRELREKYADKIIRFLQVYSSVVAIFVLLHAFKLSFKLPATFLWGFSMSFELPTDVLITLVGSTAIAAIGLVGFVAKGLFDNNNKK